MFEAQGQAAKVRGLPDDWQLSPRRSEPPAGRYRRAMKRVKHNGASPIISVVRVPVGLCRRRGWQTLSTQVSLSTNRRLGSETAVRQRSSPNLACVEDHRLLSSVSVVMFTWRYTTTVRPTPHWMAHRRTSGRVRVLGGFVAREDRNPSAGFSSPG